jgi:hypothetical protein
MHGHRLAIILTTVPRENHLTLCGMACRANESMVLDAWDSVPDHVGQDHQLGAARFTMHRSHALHSAHPSCGAVIRDFVDILTLFEVARMGAQRSR